MWYLWAELFFLKKNKIKFFLFFSWTLLYMLASFSGFNCIHDDMPSVNDSGGCNAEDSIGSKRKKLYINTHIFEVMVKF